MYIILKMPKTLNQLKRGVRLQSKIKVTKQ